MFISVVLLTSFPHLVHLPSSGQVSLGLIIVFHSEGASGTNWPNSSILHIGETEARERKQQLFSSPSWLWANLNLNPTQESSPAQDPAQM